MILCPKSTFEWRSDFLKENNPRGPPPPNTSRSNDIWVFLEAKMTQNAKWCEIFTFWWKIWFSLFMVFLAKMTQKVTFCEISHFLWKWWQTSHPPECSAQNTLPGRPPIHALGRAEEPAAELMPCAAAPRPLTPIVILQVWLEKVEKSWSALFGKCRWRYYSKIFLNVLGFSRKCNNM